MKSDSDNNVLYPSVGITFNSIGPKTIVPILKILCWMLEMLDLNIKKRKSQRIIFLKKQKEKRDLNKKRNSVYEHSQDSNREAAYQSTEEID